MKNMAGVHWTECDIQLESELEKAGLEILKADTPRGGEVQTKITGRLGELRFQRAWYYWTVEGKVPLDIAEKLYAHPEGEKSVRVAGHCGCPPPKEWAKDGFVDSYHIDTQEGLNLFVQAMRGEL